MMPFQHLTPGLVSQPGGVTGRLDNVGKQHGGQDPFRVGHPAHAGQELLDRIQD
jgi:hypothetical protein